MGTLEPCFYARCIIRMAGKRLVEKKRSSTDDLNREIVILIFIPGVHILPHRPWSMNLKP